MIARRVFSARSPRPLTLGQARHLSPEMLADWLKSIRHAQHRADRHEDILVLRANRAAIEQALAELV